MSETVLVVDDSLETVDFLITTILEPKGFNVISAVNGLMGLEMAISEKPDLMITDQQMPHLTGLELLQKLREREINIPAILMTGRGSEETAVTAFRLGIRDYIIKPIDVEEMSESIDLALRENRLERERDQLVDQLMSSNSQLQRRAQELNVLYGVGKSVSSSLDLEEVLHRVVEAAVYVVGAEEGSLMLLDRERNELYIRASWNLDSKAQSVRKRVTDSLAGRVLQTKRPVAIGNDSPTERIHTALLVKSLIYVPLVLQEEAIGVLGVMNYKHDSSFDGDDTRALSALGGYATIAINNANVYREIARERNILSAVVDENDDPVFVIDDRNRLILLNSAAKYLLELDDSNWIEKPVTDFVRNEALLQFMMNHGDESFYPEQTISLGNGHQFLANLSVISGGTRYILLRQIQQQSNTT